MAKHGRLALAKAIAKANLHRAEAGEGAATMNALAVTAGVAATTITSPARTRGTARTALSPDLAPEIVTALDCRSEEPLAETHRCKTPAF